MGLRILYEKNSETNLFKGAFGLNPLPATEDPVISETKTSDGRTAQLTNEPPRLVGESEREDET